MTIDKIKAADTSELVAVLEARLNAERAQRKRLQARLAQMELLVDGSGSDPKALTERLERLIEERTKALSLARDEAVAASHSKSSFLANMSHEIRTPLTSIIGFAELLQDPRVPKVEKVDAAKTIVRNGRHLLEVINDILDMSKIESNQLTLEKIEVGLPKLLSDIEALASSRARERALDFTIQPHWPLPPKLCTDPVRLKQILLNFCSNAIKFSTRGEVSLAVRFDPALQTLRFDVTDSGIGMDEREMARLFKPFIQADLSTTRKFGGTGLGLYISRQLADLLGARIGVTSEPGRGSRFSLTLPLGMATRPIDWQRGVSEADEVQRPVFQITQIDIPTLSGRVLVAEDGADNQRLLGSFLRQAGVDFDIVENGQLAVAEAMAREYALIFMDIQMPVMDGMSATRALRSSNYLGPIVALTANVMQSDVARYQECGCTEVLAKPIDRARFYALLRAHVPTAAMCSEPVEDAYVLELQMLTAEFVAGLPATLDAIEEAGDALDWPRLESLLHGLKGTAGSYGFPELTTLAAAAEMYMAAGQEHRAVAACGRLRHAAPRAAEPSTRATAPAGQR